MTRVAFITGITGQDGSYLADFLLERGYLVHGIVRRNSSINRTRIDHLTSNATIYNKTLKLHYADLSDTTLIRRLLQSIQPDEVYHLAGQSHVGLSFDNPESTCDFTAMGTLRLLEIIRDLRKQPRILNTGSSEVFGHAVLSPQDETTPFSPVSPYGVAKAFAVDMFRVYRRSFGLFASNVISYNHESPRRGESFVTRKISIAAAEISLGLRQSLSLGNLNVERDWGFAPEYVDAMWRALQADEPSDFVLATGQSTSLKQFLDYAFGAVGLDWRNHVEVDQRFLRPSESGSLVGNPQKARDVLGWTAETPAWKLAQIMVEADLATLKLRQNPGMVTSASRP